MNTTTQIHNIRTQRKRILKIGIFPNIIFGARETRFLTENRFLGKKVNFVDFWARTPKSHDFGSGGENPDFPPRGQKKSAPIDHFLIQTSGISPARVIGPSKSLSPLRGKKDWRFCGENRFFGRFFGAKFSDLRRSEKHKNTTFAIFRRKWKNVVFLCPEGICAWIYAQTRNPDILG